MNSIETFMIGLVIGWISAIVFMILFAKYMNKQDKENAINIAKAKWNKN